MRSIMLIGVVAGLAALACGGPSAPAVTAQHGEGQEGEHRMHEGAITFSGQGQTFKTTVLGGLVGFDSVDQVKVGVYVLQAESPERLRPTGSGPTHLFNLTFMDETTEELIREASGAVTVTGTDGRRRREEFGGFESHFQAQLRLDQPGDYLVQVDFETERGSGATRSLPFDYRWKEGEAAGRDHQADHH